MVNNVARPLPDRVLVVLLVALATTMGAPSVLGLVPLISSQDLSDWFAILALIVLPVAAILVLDQVVANAHGPRSEPRLDMRDDGIIFPDEAISTQEEDILHRSSVVDVMTRVLSDRKRSRGPMVIAVDGEWGTGKTSILRLLQERLGPDPSFLVVWFDPWQFGSTETLLAAFFRAIESEVSKRFLVPDLSRVVNQYLLALIPTASRLGVNAEVFRQPEAEVLRSTLNRLASQLTSHIVVIVDDLDRLTEQQLLLMLQLTKLSAGLDNVTYILAMDRRRVEQQLSQLGAPRYLDKFVDMDLPIGEIDRDDLDDFFIRELMSRIEAFAALKLRGVDEVERAYRTIGCRAVSSLRDAKRTLTAFSVAMELLPGEVNVVDVLLLEMIRRLSHEVWAGIAAKPEYFVYTRSREPDNENWEKARQVYYEKLFGEIPESSGLLMKLVGEVFPDSRARSVRHSYPPLEAAGNQRAADPNYFPRYFMYRLTSSAISDTGILAVIRSLNSINFTELEAYLGGVLDEYAGNVTKLFDRLIVRAEEIEGSRRLPVATAVARVSNRFRQEEGLADWFGEADRARAFIFSLAALDQDSAAIQDLLEAVVRKAASLAFAADMVWFSQQRVNHIVARWDYVDYAELQRVFDQRASSELLGSHRDILSDEPNWWRKITASWSDKAAKAKYLRQLAISTPSRIGEIVESFYRQAVPWQSSTGDFGPLQAEFDIEDLLGLLTDLGETAWASESAHQAAVQVLHKYGRLEGTNGGETDKPRGQPPS